MSSELLYSEIFEEFEKAETNIENHPKRTNTTEKKRKQLLTVILEALHKDEAELLVRLINKDLKVKFLTSKIIQEAYPNL